MQSLIRFMAIELWISTFNWKHNFVYCMHTVNQHHHNIFRVDAHQKLVTVYRSWILFEHYICCMHKLFQKKNKPLEKLTEIWPAAIPLLSNVCLYTYDTFNKIAKTIEMDTLADWLKMYHTASTVAARHIAYHLVWPDKL